MKTFDAEPLQTFALLVRCPTSLETKAHEPQRLRDADDADDNDSGDDAEDSWGSIGTGIIFKPADHRY